MVQAAETTLKGYTISRSDTGLLLVAHEATKLWLPPERPALWLPPTRETRLDEKVWVSVDVARARDATAFAFAIVSERAQAAFTEETFLHEIFGDELRAIRALPETTP